MGIPAFYRWLVERYPRSVVKVMEDCPAVVNGVQVPVDTTNPNPNGFEFDNLYLDMNGIIHPCFHPENLPAPQSYDEVFKAVFKYIDRIFSLIRPRKLLYMAIGVKKCFGRKNLMINGSRYSLSESTVMRWAMLPNELFLDGVAPRAKMNQQRARRFRAAKDAADGASESKGLDSNVITPGTGFMELLSSALQYYIHLRMNNDPSWQGIKVILSDASVPGEGEHKIMSYIRLQRNLPGFDPNTRHCLYGLDADLIMLALATHEVHFWVLREDVRREPPKRRGMSEQVLNRLSKSSEARLRNLEELISRQEFQFVNVWVLREYLAESLEVPEKMLQVDMERLIDDFVFMCVFVGNDFLPHVPSLEISEGAIDLLMDVYKKEFVRMGGYLTDCSEINLERVEHFVQALSAHEDAIFRKRLQEQRTREMHSGRFHEKISPLNQPNGRKRKRLANHVLSKMQFSIDKVNLGEDGWKERYYSEKFDVQTDDDQQRVQKDAVSKYVEGISWVMHYYYQGVCSWQWFYPYHYAPFASDFHGLDQLRFNFELGKPFKPFNQLMGVLPAASAQALPLCYRQLMTDPSSPILDFYPTEFELDLNGRKQAWKAICRLPFIDECRLLKEIEQIEHKLTDEEKQRNTLGLDKLFVHTSHPLANKISEFSNQNKDNLKLDEAKVKWKINPEFSGGMNGYIYIFNKPICPSEICAAVHNMKKVKKNKVLVVFYKYPQFHPHIPRPPEGATTPGRTIGKSDLLQLPTLWHHKTAIVERRFNRRPIPSKAVTGLDLAKLSHLLISGTALVRGGEDHVEIRKKENEEPKLPHRLNSGTAFVCSGEDQAEIRKREHEGPNDCNKDNAGIKEMTHTEPNDNKKKRKKHNKKRKLSQQLVSETASVNDTEDHAEIMKRKLEEPNDCTENHVEIREREHKEQNNSKEYRAEIKETEHKEPNDNKKKRKKRNKNRKLSQLSISGTGSVGGMKDHGGIMERKHEDPNDGREEEIKKRGHKEPNDKKEGRAEIRECKEPNDSKEYNAEIREYKEPNDSGKKRKRGNKKRKLSQQRVSGTASVSGMEHAEIRKRDHEGPNDSGEDHVEIREREHEESNGWGEGHVEIKERKNEEPNGGKEDHAKIKEMGLNASIDSGKKWKRHNKRRNLSQQLASGTAFVSDIADNAGIMKKKHEGINDGMEEEIKKIEHEKPNDGEEDHAGMRECKEPNDIRKIM